MPPWWLEDDYYREALVIQNREAFQAFISGGRFRTRSQRPGCNPVKPTRQRRRRGLSAGGKPL